MECTSCGGVLSRGERAEVCEYKGHSVTFTQPGWWCDTCDDGVFEGEDNVISNKVFLEVRARAEGIYSPTQVKRWRMRLGLTQRKASEWLGGGKNAFQKYESGDITPTMSVSLLMKIVESDRNLIGKIPELRNQIQQEPINLPEIICPH